ncbi:MAG: TnpV protein [Aminipila sp.]
MDDFKMTIECYLEELNPKVYQRLKEEGTLTQTINQLNIEAREQQRKYVDKTRDKRIKNDTWVSGYLEQLQEIENLKMEATEIIREQLEKKIRGLK